MPLRDARPFGHAPSLGDIEALAARYTEADAPDFEHAALRACQLVAAGDPRIGKVPKTRGARANKG